MGTRWDDLEILRLIDKFQEQHGGGPVWSVHGRDLMDQLAGPPRVTDDGLIRGFAHELNMARDAGLVTFETVGLPVNPDQNPDFYLQNLRMFALTIAGQDRARGRLVVQPLPDSQNDDGRLISRLVLKRIADVIETEYSADQVPVFLEESGIPLGQAGPSADPGLTGVLGVLVALTQGSSNRRALRGFIGRWLDNRLNTGPDDDTRASLLDQLARQGWYLKDGNLVTGDSSAEVGPGFPSEHATRPGTSSPADARNTVVSAGARTRTGGRYAALRDHLARSDSSPVTMTFAEIEQLVGPLPDSARRHRPWWANSSNVQAHAWRDAGWRVDSVNQAAEQVMFARGSTGQNHHDAQPAAVPASTYIDPAVAVALARRAAALGFDAAKLSRLVEELNDNYGRGNAYAAHALLRSILDHVPPMLGSSDFKSVANNYSWSRTDKAYARKLLDFKLQADDALHRQISARPDLLGIDDLPPRIWVNRILQECAD